jgi:hypothetical protein
VATSVTFPPKLLHHRPSSHRLFLAVVAQVQQLLGLVLCPAGLAAQTQVPGFSQLETVLATAIAFERMFGVKGKDIWLQVMAQIVVGDLGSRPAIGQEHSVFEVLVIVFI